MTNLARRLRSFGSEGLSLSGNDVEVLERYCIDDLPASCTNFRRVKVIFLVESPHRDEMSICHLHPLAGRSGKNITKIFSLYGVIDNYLTDPIGCLVKDKTIPWLAIMNISQLPLQKEVYCGFDVVRSSQVQRLLETFEEIKSRSERRRINVKEMLGYSNIHEAIICDLERRIRLVSRLCCLYRRQILVIPCGLLARNFLCAAGGFMQTERTVTYDRKVPHPSLWMVKKNRYDLKCLMKKLVNHIN